MLASRRLGVLSRHLGECIAPLTVLKCSAAVGSRKYEYDLVVIGGGSGGLACSKESK